MQNNEPKLRLDEQRAQWRAELVTAIRPITGLLSLMGFLAIAFLMKRSPRLFPMVGFSVLFIASCFPRIPTGLRALLISLATPLMCILGLPFFGFAPNIFTGLLVGGAFSLLVLERRLALRVNLVMGAGVVAMMGLVATGVVQVSPLWGLDLDPNRPGNVIRVLILFLVAGGTLAFSVSHVLQRMERIVEEKSHTLQSLEITSAKKQKLEEDVLEFEKQAARTRELEQLGRLASYFGHDANNALLVVSSSLDILRDPTTNEHQRSEALQSLEDASYQIRNLSSQLRAFSPARRKGPGKADLRSVMDGSYRMLRQILPRDIKVSMGQVPKTMVAMDEPELQRILANLALNARDAMKDHGTLSIQVRMALPSELPEARRQNEQQVVIEIRDSGEGMLPAIKDKIFEPYFTTKGEKGTGLGLPSVQQGVESCGGKVQVESQPGSGTMFSLFIPVYQPSQNLKCSTNEIAYQAGPILVMDEPLVQNAVLRALQANFLVAHGANTIAKGIDLLEQETEGASLIIIGDPDLPGLWALHAALVARNPRGRIIACVAQDMDPTALPPSVAILAKPFTMPELFKMIDQQMAERAKADQRRPNRRSQSKASQG